MTGLRPGAAGRRLAVTLGLWILPAFILAMMASLWMSATTITELSDSAYDRSLAGAIRAVDANISTESGGVGIELPYNLFAFFELTAQGRVYFNVSTDDKLVQIGDVLLPRAENLDLGQLRFEDVIYLGEAVRMGSLRRPLDASRPSGTSITTCKLAQATLAESGAVPSPMRVSYMPGGIGAVAYNAIVGQRRAEPGTIVAFSAG